jgi:hypothetical protein
MEDGIFAHPLVAQWLARLAETRSAPPLLIELMNISSRILNLSGCFTLL